MALYAKQLWCVGRAWLHFELEERTKCHFRYCTPSVKLPSGMVLGNSLSLADHKSAQKKEGWVLEYAFSIFVVKLYGFA